MFIQCHNYCQINKYLFILYGGSLNLKIMKMKSKAEHWQEDCGDNTEHAIISFPV